MLRCSASLPYTAPLLNGRSSILFDQIAMPAAGSLPPDAADPLRWNPRPTARPREMPDAAVAAFVAEGYESATIAEVAPQSAVNPGLVARHWGSKAEGATP